MISPKFVAIPVGQGDSFFLATVGNKNILVDGGKSISSFPSSLRTHIAVTEFDVVICSHNDADHANGLIGLLSGSSPKIKEVWRPGRWTDRLRDLLTNFPEFIDELASDARTVSNQNISIEQLANQESKFSPDSIDDMQDSETMGAQDEANFDDFFTENSIDCATIGFLLPPFRHLFGSRLFVSAIEAAKRIVEVASAARHHGARIRWFDFDDFMKIRSPDGGEDWMRPVNAREMKAIKPRKVDALNFLTLSVANRESLVFYSPETQETPGVIFTADSDLNFPIKYSAPSRPVIVTAPHHGSEANAAAYCRVNHWTKSGDLWIRSDGKFKHRPGTTFLKLPKISRFCTICMMAGTVKSEVRAVAPSGVWSITTPGCQCR